MVNTEIRLIIFFAAKDGGALSSSYRPPPLTSGVGYHLSGWALTSSNNTREDSTHGHHQMVNAKIGLIICFAAIDGEALYTQQKQDQELTAAQIMNSLLPNSDLN